MRKNTKKWTKWTKSGRKEGGKIRKSCKNGQTVVVNKAEKHEKVAKMGKKWS